MTGRSVDETTAEQAAEAGVEGAFPLLNNRYKIQIARALVKSDTSLRAGYRGRRPAVIHRRQAENDRPARTGGG